MITFRELTDTPADLEALRAFYDTLYVSEFPDPDERESLEHMADYLRRKARGWYGSNSYHIVLGVSGDEVVAASVSDYLAEPNAGVIEFLLIAPGHRGAGTGRRLLEHTEALFAQDALRGRGRPLDCVLAEMNDPLATSALTDNLDPVTRALIWHRWGYRGLDFPYQQPALSDDQGAVTNLILICKPLREDWSASVPARVVGTAVHEYLRWAMRIDKPAESPEFQQMAAALSGAEDVALLPLDRYVGRDAARPLHVRHVRDGGEPEFAAAMRLYRTTFPPGPLTVPETGFRDALADAGYHLWTLRGAADDAEPEGLASFFSLPAAGFVGYLALTGTLHGAGLLRPLTALLETGLLADRTSVRGWYAEVGPHTDITPYRHVGCHELAVDYRQPGCHDVPLRLVFKPLGRVYAAPRLSPADLLADVADILATVYGVTDAGHPTYTRVAASLPERSDTVPLR